jgi:hypothetical protein
VGLRGGRAGTVVVVDPEGNRADRPEEDDDVHHPAEVVHCDGAVTRRGVSEEHGQHDAERDDAQPDRQHAHEPLVRGRLPAPYGDEQQEHGAAHQGQVGQQRGGEMRRDRQIVVVHQRRPSPV